MSADAFDILDLHITIAWVRSLPTNATIATLESALAVAVRNACVCDDYDGWDECLYSADLHEEACDTESLLAQCALAEAYLDLTLEAV